MANKKLSYDQIAEQNLFDPLKKQIQEVDKLLQGLGETLKETIKESAEIAKQTPLKGYKNIKSVQEAIEKTTKAVKDLDQVERDRQRLQQRLKNLEDGRAKANFRLREEIRLKTRALKQEAILTSSATSEYQKQSVLLIQLRDKYKELALTQGENSKEAREAAKAAQELDKRLKKLDKTVGQSQRNVGNYEGAVKKLNTRLKNLGRGAAAFVLIEKLSEAFQSNRASADQFAKVMGRVTVTLAVFVQRVIRVPQAIGNIFRQIGTRIDIFFTKLQKGFADLPSLLGGSTEKSEELAEKLETLQQRSTDLADRGVGALKDAFAGMGTEILELIRANDRLIDQTTRYERIAIGLKTELADLVQTQGELQITADDNTISLQRQQAAAIQLLEVNAQIAEKNQQIAGNELELARQRKNIRVGDLEAEKAFVDAYVNFQQVQAEASKQRAEVEKRQREIRRDQLELELDRLFDVSDRRKSIAEKEAAEESNTMQERIAALQQAGVDIENTYREIAKKISDETGVAIDIDQLLSIEDTTELNERLADIDIDEITQNRLREGLIERLAAVNDLKLAQIELNEAQQEYQETSEDVFLQEELLEGIQQGRIQAVEVLDMLEQRRHENEILRLQDEINLAKEGSQTRIELEKKLNDILLKDAAARARKQEEDRQKRIAAEQQANQRILQDAQQFFDFLGDLSQDAIDRRLDALDRQVEASQRREDQLREAAAEGIQDAEQNIVTEQRIQAEAERQRQATLRREKLAELGLLALKVYAAKLEQGDPNALASTGFDLNALTAFISTLPAFNEGTELVKKDLDKFKPGIDGYLTRVDGGERILTTYQNSLIPSEMSNMDLAFMANSAAKVSKSQAKETSSNLAIEQKLDGVIMAIEQIELYKGMDFDKQKEALTFHIEKKGKRLRVHKRIGGLF